jgi:MtN3 and saliva related transmembrane protein
MRMAHHFHIRKRREPYPAKTLALRMLDIVVLIVGIIGPLATIPQVLQIYITHTALGISFVTWSLYALCDIPWVIYAIVHREPPLFVCYVLWFTFNSLVAIGVLLYSPALIF